MFEITSVQNPKIKCLLQLRERRERDKSGLFLIEGYRELLRALDASIEVKEIYFCKNLFLGANEERLVERVHGPHYNCSQKVFEKISYRDRPDGLIGVAVQKKKGLGAICRSGMPFLVASEAIEKPGNLGTILRSCDGVGVDGLILCDACTDLYNPNTVRASVGTLFTVPIFEASSNETIAWLKKNKIAIVAATPQGSCTYTQANLIQPICIAVGTEQLGLSDAWMQAADLQVSIPMRGAADSLNVAMATTLLLYETLRQRNPHPL